ncbi:MAG: ATP-dependent Clp protease ATP-binding subunit [Planctomycetes bacterium]|nr:ATP-dependent Clp protease ATP-binding subunit [Planctomycetota bacterium]
MFDRFTDRAKKVMNLARQEAQRFNHEYLGTEHILLGLVQEGSGVAANVLKNMNIDLSKIRAEVEKIVKTGPSMVTMGQLPFTPRAKKVLELSMEEASNLGHNYIGTEHLLLGLIKENEGIAAQVLMNLGVKLEDVREEVLEFLGADTQEEEEEESSIGDAGAGQGQGGAQGGSGGGGSAGGSGNTKSKTPALDAFGRDLTELARQGKLDVVIGRANEIERVIQILSRRTKNNPVLLGEPGVGKTAIVEGLGQRIIDNEVPEILRNKRIVVLDLALMVAGTKYRGQFEERIKAVMTEVRRVRDVVLFIDELHTLVGAGGAEGAIDASNVLKPALSRGEIQCIGATTLDEYRKHIEKDGALERRFQAVVVEPPSPTEAVEILKGLRDRYEAHHRVKYTDEALALAVELATRYINNRFLPDKAIDVMDEAGARVRIKSMVPPPNLKEITTEIERLDRAKDEAVTSQDFEKAAQLRDQAYQLRKKKEEMQKEWRTSQQGKEDVGKVDTEVIAETVSKMTGIPLTRLERAEADRLLQMEEELGRTVIHQDDAIKAIARSIRRSRSGLKDPRRPMGSFVFLGPSGVGKTYLCKQLAKFMFGSEEAVTAIDMSEYMEKHNASRLVGAPPGYVGYEEGGQLTEKVRRRPYSVVLLDEIEKAHPDVFNMLLQIMEEGRLTDSFGRHVDFRNVILIMTSNLGSHQIKGGAAVGFGKGDTVNVQEDRAKRIKSDVMIEVERHFRPEFLNRVDELVVFNQLSKEDLKRIVELQLTEVRKRLGERGIKLELTPEAIEFLITKGHNDDFGARPLRRAIERFIEDPLAEQLLRADNKANTLIRVTHVEKAEDLTLTTVEPPPQPVSANAEGTP